MKKREEFIKFRVTEGEKETIQKRAEKQGLKVSDFGRKMLLNGTVFAIEKEDIVDLKKIGGNIYQLVRHANFHQHFDTEKVLKEYQSIKILLDEILEKSKK